MLSHNFGQVGIFASCPGAVDGFPAFLVSCYLVVSSKGEREHDKRTK